MRAIPPPPPLALLLLVLRVVADHHDAVPSADHLALLAHPPDRRAHLHETHPLPVLLPVAVGDASPRGVVGGQLDLDPIPREDPDEMDPHLARDVGEDPVARPQLHPKHGVGYPPPHGPLHLDNVLLAIRYSPAASIPRKA